jgi:hypothetical protein
MAHLFQVRGDDADDHAASRASLKVMTKLAMGIHCTFPVLRLGVPNSTGPEIPYVIFNRFETIPNLNWGSQSAFDAYPKQVHH